MDDETDEDNNDEVDAIEEEEIARVEVVKVEDVDPTVDIDDELEMLEDDVVVVIPGASVLELVVFVFTTH